MERAAFMLKLKEGMYNEYKKRHEEIWNEMKEELKKAGRSNYSIWYADHKVFGYYEVENMELCRDILSKSAVFQRWNEYMKELLEPVEDGEEDSVLILERVYYLK